MKLTRPLSQSIGTVCVYGDLIRHFADLDTACILSEIIKTSEEELARDEKAGGWFPRTYETWQQLTGISASRVRDVCMKLATDGFIQVAVWPRGGNRISHFRPVIDYIVQKLDLKIKREKVGACPVCGGNVLIGDKTFFCSNKINGEFCVFRIWKNTLMRWGVPEMPTGMVRRLLSDGRVEATGLRNRNKQSFACTLTIGSKPDGSTGIVFIYADKKKEEVTDGSTSRDAA